MKNKKNTYLLLLVVLVIWGLVVYQFFYFSKSIPSNPTSIDHFVYKPIQVKKRDTSSLNLNYRDPFLGKMYIAENEPKIRANKVKSIKPIVNSAPITLQTIVYKGIVSDTKDKTKIFMLIINGHTFLMKKGDSESDVVLKDGNRETITITNKGTMQKIPLQV